MWKVLYRIKPLSSPTTSHLRGSKENKIHVTYNKRFFYSQFRIVESIADTKSREIVIILNYKSYHSSPKVEHKKNIDIPLSEKLLESAMVTG